MPPLIYYNLKSAESGEMAAEESELCEYDVDDDFIELFVQFGRVALFAAAMPIIAPLSAFVNNLVEARTDALKLLTASRRPRIESASGIGAWVFAFRCIAALSVVTNVALVISISLSGEDSSGATDTGGGGPLDIVKRCVISITYLPLHSVRILRIPFLTQAPPLTSSRPL